MLKYNLKPFIDYTSNVMFVGATAFESNDKCLLFEKTGHIVLCRKEVVNNLKKNIIPDGMIHIFLQRNFVKTDSWTTSFVEEDVPISPEFFMIDLTNKCCMQCRYCLRNINFEEKQISVDKLRDVCRYIVDFCDKENPTNITIQPWGGEPLLNLDSIFEMKKLIKPKFTKVHYSLETNGILLSKNTIRELKKRNINISVSIDGTKELHDSQRVMPDGTGTFRIIESNIKNLKEQYNDKFGSITTLTKNNACMVDKILEYYAKELGLQCVKFNYVHKSSFFDCDDLCLEKNEIMSTQLKLLRTLICLHEEGYKIMDENILTKLKNLLFNSFSDICLSKGCNGGKKMVVFDMEGGIYPCELTDYPEEKIGSIYDGRPLKQVIKDAFVLRDFFSVKKCKKCVDCLWQCYCRGGCTMHVKSMKGIETIDPIECSINEVLYPELIKLVLEKPNIVNHFFDEEIIF